MAYLFDLAARAWMRPLAWLALCAAMPAAALDRLQVEGYQLPNGLQVILKPGYDRGHVAIRLVVGVGFDDFPCDRQELPHLLEHLLFSGLDDSGEGGLEARMQALGGEWNAFTSTSDTTFVIEAPARNQRKVLDLLLDIITRTRIDEHALQESQRIVEHEDGGHYSHLQRLLDRSEVDHGAVDALAVELGLKCADRSSANDLTLAQVQAVRERWYAANNMSLIVVGDLDRLLPAYLERRYGELKPVDNDDQQPLLTISHAAAHERTLAKGWLGDGATVHWYFIEPALNDEPPETLDLLQGYLDWALYTQLRLEHGLSYGPWSQRDAFGDSGLLSLNADLDRQDVDQAKAILAELVHNLREKGLDPVLFERLKQQAIARQAWATQGNTALADYYWNNLGDYDDGHFTDPARALRDVTLDQSNRVMRRLFDKPGYLRIEQARLSDDQLYALGGAVAGLLVVLLLVAVCCRRRQPGAQ